MRLAYFKHVTVCAISLFCSFAQADQEKQRVRAGTLAAGDPIPGLTTDERKFFDSGLERFEEVDSVSGTEPGAPAVGLGPRFNLNSCVGCHSFPAVGGSSPPINPAIAVATQFGAQNKIPFFIQLAGPVREARFIFNPDGTRDGSVHNLFVITGREDAPGCGIAQPDFTAQGAQGNLALRIPIPLFGDGLMQEIPDSTLLANKTSQRARKRALGISGHENRNENDGTITRFGWKAQNKSIELFAGEAYNVEQGVTNEIFPNEREDAKACVFNGTPEDHTNFDAPTPVGSMSDTVGFTQFMRFLAPLEPSPQNPSIKRGTARFVTIGCALCHTPTLETGLSSSGALSFQKANLYSDLLVHRMGPELADNIIQGNAGPDEFRTAPLWGLSQRLFFLHDGRTNDLLTAIQAHASTSFDPNLDSEANAVIANFNALPASQRDDVLNFLRSL